MSYPKYLSNFKINSIYPNPFNPKATLEFSLALDNKVSIKIYNLNGQEVASLLDKNLEQGSYTVSWNAYEQGSGVYFIKIKVDENIYTKKIILLK